MKIGVLSDTHKKVDLALAAIKEMGAIDLLLHAGDHYRDALVIAENIKLPYYAVVGNCDFTSGPEEQIIDLMGHRILLVHGHKFNVKSSLQNLWYYAQEKEADLVVFGHSHTPLLQKMGEVCLFNPGSLAESRDRLIGPSYGIITLTEEIVHPEIICFRHRKT